MGSLQGSMAFSCLKPHQIHETPRPDLCVSLPQGQDIPVSLEPLLLFPDTKLATALGAFALAVPQSRSIWPRSVGLLLLGRTGFTSPF